MIGGIILAAGMSTRMEGSTPKQLMLYRGQPLVAAVAAGAVESDLDWVAVVVGHRADDVAAAVASQPVTVVHNPDFAGGNMTSFRAGHAACPACDAYVVMLADTPGVTSSIINQFVACWRSEQPWAAIGKYRDGTGHPILLSADAMRVAAEAEGPRAVWKLLERAPEGAVAHVELDTARPIDVNTIEDYELLD